MEQRPVAEQHRKPSIYDLSLAELTHALAGWGEPAFRARQVWEWLYQHKVDRFEAMANVPRALRDRLDAAYSVGTLLLVAEIKSSDGHTVKRLLELPDGQMIESVLMEYDGNRRTACISTQAGCAMGCVFCATGQMGFSRHLTPGEIVEQAVVFARQLEAAGERLSNVVLMGMGEPLHNYDATLEAIARLNDEAGLNIGQRHITLSTVGLVPAIRRFADENLQIGLAISLHAATDEERGKLLPINRRWPLADLMDAIRYYIDTTGRRVTFEWALIAGENDTAEQADRLGQLVRGLKCHVNLIPLNPTESYAGQPPDPARIEAFQQRLHDYGVNSTVRVRRGIDIHAGCGQLKADVVKRSRAKRVQPDEVR
ncbi:23S rRNA (adenine(2503)-C(2))-methyltransferase RlmN [Aggregatilinea lenta]|uniref:23S rRNA (adenine(2503)-C(2))-methyltransferase RlmN n=1 Tax=Aggregatilinea lenta TaxID=913108 RepID=UPI000E5B3CAE|nr:23S rRNA (adenine(2503)-C(2))-methyltransferase RlmN [Aggregatilinea lenta]